MSTNVVSVSAIVADLPPGAHHGATVGPHDADVEWDPKEPFFYFVPSATVLACSSKSLPRMQTLRQDFIRTARAIARM